MIDGRKLDELMESLSFGEALAGTDLIRRAVTIMDAKPGLFITKELYPALAKATGRSPQQVERNMRHAISNAVGCCDWLETQQAWQQFIGGQNPSVSEVVARLARRCRIEN